MAEDPRKGFPMMATPNWWGVRRKFRAAIPREVTANYLASALGMNEDSARKNILPSLRLTGIVDKDGKPTNLAVRWRDDAQYPAVCAEIRAASYPQELLDLASDTSVTREVVRTWFANHTGGGESAAQKMAAFYFTLLEADPTKQVEAATSAPANKQSVRAAKPSRAPTRVAAIEAPPAAPRSSVTPSQPNLHINVQIHIASDATPDQIDQIFASMAKHLKNSV